MTPAYRLEERQEKRLYAFTRHLTLLAWNLFITNVRRPVAPQLTVVTDTTA